MTEQTMTDAQIIEHLKAENARLKANKAPSQSIKVSTKGAISVYGLGRFPVTLYASQWQSLLEKQDSIREFIVNNIELLKQKEA